MILYHGSQAERRALWPKLRSRKTIPKGHEAGVLPVVITSYEVAMKDLHPLQDRHWEMIIIDEGHRIKNSKCKLVRYV